MYHTPDFIIDIIKPRWSPGMKVLEVGCGSALLRNVFGTDYIGTDITDKPYYPDLPRDIDFVCSAEALSVNDKSVNLVIIVSAFFLFPNYTTALKEAFRVLKPGGELIIFDYNQRTQKKLQSKEGGHHRYPCWTQWGLKKVIQKTGFNTPKLFIAETGRAKGLRYYYRLLRQELRGDWAIAAASKPIGCQEEIQ